MLQITRVQPHGNEVPSSRPPLERPGVMRWDENWYHKDLDYCLSLYIIISLWLIRASGGPHKYIFQTCKVLVPGETKIYNIWERRKLLDPRCQTFEAQDRKKMSFFMQHVVIIFWLLLLYVHLFLTQPLNSAHWGALWNKQIWKKMGSIQVNFRFLMISGKIIRIGTHGWWW